MSPLHDAAHGRPTSADGDEAEPGRRAPSGASASVDAALHGQRLDKAVVALAPEFSRSHLQRLIDGGHVRVDGASSTPPVAPACAAGQRVDVELMPTAESRAFRPEPMALRDRHEDEHVLVIDKPAGLVVHPAAGNWSGTLLNGLLARDPAAAALPRAGIVHRLDKDTSGLMVVGKTLAGGDALVRAIAAREVQRQYLALAHGAARAARCTHRGADRPRSRSRACAWRSSAAGKPARTDVELRRRSAAALRACAARCTPAARTRSASTSRRAAIRWSPTRSTAARRRSAWRARRCMPRGWRSRTRSRGAPLAFDCRAAGRLRRAWRDVRSRAS